MSTNPNDFLLGGGGKSAAFENVGDTITGTVVSTEVRQQTDFKTGVPETWDNGDPKLQLVVALQTTERDPADPDDDGVRNVYVKGSKKGGSRSLHDAVRTAVQTAGAKGLEPGGTLTVTFVDEEPPQNRGLSPRKLWSATYAAPDQAAQSGGFLGTQPTASATPVAPASAAPATPAPAAAPASDPVATARQLIAAGLDDSVVSQSTGLDQAVVAALRNAA